MNDYVTHWVGGQGYVSTPREVWMADLEGPRQRLNAEWNYHHNEIMRLEGEIIEHQDAKAAIDRELEALGE